MRGAVFSLVLLVCGCSKPIGHVSLPAPPSNNIIVRVWVENPMRPDDCILATLSLADAINACDDLAVVDISGFSEQLLDIRVDPKKLQICGVNFSDVVSAVGEAIPKRVADRMSVDHKDLLISLISFTDHIDDTQRIKDISTLLQASIEATSGSSVRLADISSLSERQGRPQASHLGEPALYLLVKTGGSHVRLREVLTKYREGHPSVRVDQVPSSEWPLN